MINTDMDHLLSLSEERAVLTHFDGYNFRWFKVCLCFFFALAVYCLVFQIIEDEPYFFPIVCHSLNIGLTVFLFLSRNKKFLINNFYSHLLTYLFLQFLLLALARESWESVSYWGFLFPHFLFLFRLKTSGFFILYGGIFGFTFFDSFFPGETNFAFVFSGIMSATYLTVSIMVTTLIKRKFLAVWRIERNNRERLRMKKELNHARDIQLSLLPLANPEIPHFELSGASVPATEVGGDYYEYFQVTPEQLVLVIGDVSGHGVASGMVLSGVRSCLYMLKENLPNPSKLLAKLNRMLKLTTDKRMFMTFLYLLFDADKKALTLSNAGHPPMIHYDHDKKTITEIKQKALPLGGILNAPYSEKTISFSSGDLFILYTDGLTEARNAKNEEYGLERLIDKIKAAAPSTRSAEHIRNMLMENVAIFMGNQEQDDDITVVVARIK